MAGMFGASRASQAGVGGGVAQSPIAPANPAAATEARRRLSDQRFRSFCERYVVARAGLFRVAPNEHDEDMWRCILDAKRCYALIRRTGENIDPEDGA